MDAAAMKKSEKEKECACVCVCVMACTGSKKLSPLFDTSFFSFQNNELQIIGTAEEHFL